MTVLLSQAPLSNSSNSSSNTAQPCPETHLLSARFALIDIIFPMDSQCSLDAFQGPLMDLQHAVAAPLFVRFVANMYPHAPQGLRRALSSARHCQLALNLAPLTGTDHACSSEMWIDWHSCSISAPCLSKKLCHGCLLVTCCVMAPADRIAFPPRHAVFARMAATDHQWGGFVVQSPVLPVWRYTTMSVCAAWDRTVAQSSAA